MVKRERTEPKAPVRRELRFISAHAVSAVLYRGPAPSRRSAIPSRLPNCPKQRSHALPLAQQRRDYLLPSVRVGWLSAALQNRCRSKGIKPTRRNETEQISRFSDRPRICLAGIVHRPDRCVLERQTRYRTWSFSTGAERSERPMILKRSGASSV